MRQEVALAVKQTLEVGVPVSNFCVLLGVTLTDPLPLSEVEPVLQAEKVVEPVGVAVRGVVLLTLGDKVALGE